MHNAVCGRGRSGFLWVAITQSIIVVLSLAMLSIRIGCFHDYYEVEDNLYSTSIGDDFNQQQPDTTMLTEDEEDSHNEEIESNDLLKTSSGALGVEQPNSKMYDEKEQSTKGLFAGEQLKQTTAVVTPQLLDPQNPHVRSSQRILRRNRSRASILRGNKQQQHHGGNYIASTSLYSIGAPDSFDPHYDADNEENMNVEIYLDAPNKILSRFQNAEEKKGIESIVFQNTSDNSGEREHQHLRPHRHRSPASTDDLFVEADRVRERLRGIKERRSKLAERQRTIFKKKEIFKTEVW